MLVSPQFKPLLEHHTAIVGHQVIRNDLATVMVTVMDPQHGLSVYRFYLERQPAGPYAGCWMTYGVTRDADVEPQPSPTGRSI